MTRFQIQWGINAHASLHLEGELSYEESIVCQNGYFTGSSVIIRHRSAQQEHILFNGIIKKIVFLMDGGVSRIHIEAISASWKLDQRRVNCSFQDKEMTYAALVPWQTINAPYLYKIADVVITELPDGIAQDDSVKRIEINFEKFNQVICHDLIPIWNIQKLTLNSVGFPVPCEDHKNFEHSISIDEYGTQHVYLAEDNLEIQSISQREERLMIISEVSVAQKWDIYMIRNSEDSKIDRYTYPIMQNGRAENFSEKFQRRWNQSIKTRAELARFIKGFGLEWYVTYQDCKIIDQFDMKVETYSMNPFIEDEVRDTRAQKKLLLQFRAGEGDSWLQRDVASFLVTEVQRIYPEYECGGIIV